jgi:aspartyl-tRNA(Asn)/glutamyl-tRNA(Gln) amidotransferase subunit A
MKLFATASETIDGVGQALRAGHTTCLDVLDACLARTEEWEPKVRAWVLVDRAGAVEQARRLDEERAAGRWRGPLHGIPIGIKDIIDVAGLPTACGSRLRADRVARDDAEIVARLRAAGAVILGKTVTTQYAWIDPPVTRNPWNLDRTPGGSSSGSAAAVACGMCLGAIGSQTGGSITRPASFCGAAGCKPSHARVSVRGVLPFAPSLDHPGPIARTVRDLALLLDAIAGHDPLDPLSSPCAAAVPGIAAHLDAEPAPRPPRLGRLRHLFDAQADPVMRHAFDRALATLSAAGAAVSEPPLPPEFDDVLGNHRLVMAAEAAAGHESWLAAHPDDYLPQIRSLISEGLAAPALAYIRARWHQALLSRAMLDCFDGLDALATPATLGPAPDPETTGHPAFNAPWSYTGLPTVSFPIGLSPDGLPLAIQLVGRPFAEAELFAAALWCEEVIQKEEDSPQRHKGHKGKVEASFG